MEKLTIYYNISNDGDGSASTNYFESRELTAWDEEFQIDFNGDGWGEPCNGYLSFESETPIKPLFDVVTKEQYFIETYLEDDYRADRLEESLQNFLHEFFPNGFPKCISTVEATSKPSEYHYLCIWAANKRIAKIFTKGTEEIHQEILAKINKYN